MVATARAPPPQTFVEDGDGDDGNGDGDDVGNGDDDDDSKDDDNDDGDDDDDDDDDHHDHDDGGDSSDGDCQCGLSTRASTVPRPVGVTGCFSSLRDSLLCCGVEPSGITLSTHGVSGCGVELRVCLRVWRETEVSPISRAQLCTIKARGWLSRQWHYCAIWLLEALLWAQDLFGAVRLVVQLVKFHVILRKGKIAPAKGKRLKRRQSLPSGRSSTPAVETRYV